jgi:glycosyltransferase involved in cell wall biosynthesis
MSTANKIRVLELRSAFGAGGGPEKTILYGAARADERFEITVCYLRDARDRKFDIAERAKRLGVEYVDLWEKSSFDPAIWPKLRQLVRERKIDIVHAHEYKTDLLAWMLARAEGIIPLATVHGWTGHSTREMLYYAADRRILARYPKLVAVSSEIRRRLLRVGAKPERVQVILNGIDHERFYRDPARRAPVRESLGLKDGEVAIGSVGRLEPQKRFDVLMEAFARLRPSRPELRLLIAGEGSIRADLEAKIRELGIGDACRLLGHRSDVDALHHALDLFVQASDYEGTPNSVLEAMAFETPVVATDAGGTAEIARHGLEGLIVPIGKPIALASAIEETLANPEARKARVAAARARVEGELSFENRTRSIEAVYAEIYARSGRWRSVERGSGAGETEGVAAAEIARAA